MQPRRDVADADRDVGPHARLGDLARRGRDVQQIRCLRRHVVAQPLQLVRALAEHGVELGHRDRDEVRVRHPGPVEAVLRLTPLVFRHPCEGDLVHLGIATARDERGHSADRVGSALMARAHEELRVRPHERHGHRHLHAVREDELGPVAELLDDREDVVPAAGVEPGRVLAELVENLLHLERREDRLDEDGRLDRAARNPDAILGEAEDVVPESRLEVILELREIEVRPRSTREQPLGVA